MQKEDVYETSDLPEDDQQMGRNEEKFDSDYIETVHINVDSALQRFKGRSLATDNVDFSDSLADRRRRGYGSGQYVLEIVGNEAGDETPEQRFHRLHHEINELSQQVQDIKKTSEKQGEAEALVGSVSADDVAGLQQQLKQLQVEQILGQGISLDVAELQGSLAQKLTDTVEKLQKAKSSSKADQKGAGSQLSYEVFVRSNAGRGAADSKAAELESRLAKLETLLGPDSDKLTALTGNSRSRGLVDAIEMLQQKVQLLDPNYVEGLDARMTALLQKLTQVSEKKSQMDAEDIGQVNELYELMKKWDNFSAALPDLVARMQALENLHEQAIQFSQGLTQLDAIQQQLTKTLETDSALLNEVKTSLGQNVDMIKTNCENLEKRLKALGK